MTTPNAAPSSSNASHALPKAKLSAVSRFKQLAGIKSEPKIVFPPPSWFITDDVPPSSASPAAPETVEPHSDPRHSEELEPPEPTTFALKIRQMIEALPLPASVTAAISTGHARQTSAAPDMPQVDSSGPPIPDGVDARTMQLLSSEAVMNGDYASHGHSRGSYRQSVWAALERLKPGHSTEQTSVQQLDVNTGPGTSDPTEHNEKGVMMYSPLEPTADSEVEIATETTEPAHEHHLIPGTAPPPPTMVTHWVPSTTKLSVYTTWWGYRLYLPPPVMETLNSSQMKATQRAAMVTTALTWFLKRVPTVMIPAPMIPTVKVLRRLAPFLGYIGVFIAWSWGRIAACDKGNGVVLTATWILPVALLPMAWDAGDIYGPPNRPPTPEAISPTSAGHPAPQQDQIPGSEGKKKKRYALQWTINYMYDANTSCFLLDSCSHMLQLSQSTRILVGGAV
ncbi:hypothetical protein H0H92_001146 [Tricholoma furcatifolium]|nr:hypothetical protein H0H92_001146 [Tricholoma furcatifolium]